jgi:hypothetical protein
MQHLHSNTRTSQYRLHGSSKARHRLRVVDIECYRKPSKPSRRPRCDATIQDSSGHHFGVLPSLWGCSNTPFQLNQHCRRVLIECLGSHIHDLKGLNEDLQATTSTFPRFQPIGTQCPTCTRTAGCSLLQTGNNGLDRPISPDLSIGLAPKHSRAVMVGGVMEGNGWAEVFALAGGCTHHRQRFHLDSKQRQQISINTPITRCHPPRLQTTVSARWTEIGQTGIPSHPHWTGSSRHVCNGRWHDPRICYFGYQPIDDARRDRFTSMVSLY